MQKMLVLCGVILAASAGFFEAHEGTGLHETELIADQTIESGIVSIWASPQKLMVQIETAGEWKIAEIQIFAGTDEPPIDDVGNPVPGEFSLKVECKELVRDKFTGVFDRSTFAGGHPEFLNIAVHVDLVELNDIGEIIEEEGAWAFGPNEFGGTAWGWYLSYDPNWHQ